MTKDAGVDAIILAGGLGTRLQSVIADIPKPLAPVNGRPFLDYQLDLARAAGVRKVVLAAGHLAQKVYDHYAENAPPLPLEIVVETERLGTGGAVANALHATSSRRVLVLNGDSIFNWSLFELAAALEAVASTEGGASMGVIEVEDVSRFGGVEVSEGQVTAFHEKRRAGGRGLINAGAYLFDRSVLDLLPREKPTSLEHELFPRLAHDGRLAAALHLSAFVDIGLPESYASAAGVLKQLDHY